MIILYSSAAFITGFVIDLIFGDPHGFPHIIRVFGLLIERLEKLLRAGFTKTQGGEYTAGITLVILMLLICGGVPFILLRIAYVISPWLGFIVESVLCWQLLAVKSLRCESMKVYKALSENDIEKARGDLSMIVGRDVSQLDESGITRAAVETVAENTSDGVVAPIIFIAIGGAVLGCIYKAVNTMDSMVGYKNDRYLYFGRTAAELDDFMNYLPSRIAALLIVISCIPLKFDTRGAYRIWKRDRRNHASPNSAQTEAACAGALGIRLLGPASYFGKLHDKPYVGDALRPVTPEDIRAANKLLYAAAVFTMLAAVCIRGLIYALL